MTKSSIHNLNMRIGELVREHLMATRSEAELALRRAFSDAGLKWERGGEKPVRKEGSRRLKVELETLSARLLELVNTVAERNDERLGSRDG
jgi:hypothetical protein